MFWLESRPPNFRQRQSGQLDQSTPNFGWQTIRINMLFFFFYPLDFTFVCPTELIAFSHRIKDFELRDVQVVGCSVDSQFIYLAYGVIPLCTKVVLGKS